MNFSKLCFLFLSLFLCFQADLGSYEYEDQTIDAAMYSAITKSNSKLVTSLIQQGADVNSLSPWGGTNLGMAVLLNKMEIVKILLENGANPNLIGDSGSSLPLISAISNGNIKMVELLLDYDADPQYDPKGRKDSPINYAYMTLGYPSLNGKCHPIVALLLKHIEEKDNDGLEN